MILRGLLDRFSRTRTDLLVNLSPVDRQILATLSKNVKLTPLQIIQLTNLKRRTVYARLSVLIQRGIVENRGGVYSYKPKRELKTTPFIAIIAGISAGYAYITNNPAVMFFLFLTFVVAYVVEQTK